MTASGTGASHWPGRSRPGRASPPAPCRACDSSTCARCRARCAPNRRCAAASRARAPARRCVPAPRRKMICLSSPSASSNGTWIAPQGSSAAPSLPDRRDLRQRVGIRERAVPAEEFGAISAQRPRQVVDVEEGDPARKLAVVGVAREQCSARRVDLGDDVRRGFRAQVAEHPLDESGGRQAPRAAGSIAHLEDRELDRVVDVHVDPELGMDAAGGVLEDAVPESVAGPVRHRSARREGRR